MPDVIANQSVGTADNALYTHINANWSSVAIPR